MKHTPKEYQSIQKWGERLGSLQYYIDGEKQKAADQQAPLNSVYFSDSSQRWVTTDDLGPAHPLSTRPQPASR